MNDVTTKQQGKMLLKAGLEPDTATMYHDTDNMGNVESANALCKEIVRRFNEFPEELKQ